MMTKADWVVFEDCLAYPYGSAELLCDGYTVLVRVLQYKPLAYRPFVYVNGEFKSVWMNAKHPCEEQRRFMRRQERPLHSPAQMAEYKKLFRAAQLREMAAKRYVIFHAFWPNAAALRRHLVANNTSITLLKPRPADQTDAPPAPVPAPPTGAPTPTSTPAEAL